VRLETILEAIVGLRLAIAQTRDAGLRGELRDVETRLRRELGPSVPKRAAARMLGVSVTALDRWIDRGRIPVVARPASSRLAVETPPLLEVATEVERLRRNDVTRSRVARALTNLGRFDDPRGRLVIPEEVAALPRPNVPVHELRRRYEETTPEERVLQVSALSRSVHEIVRGRA
jgi:hypothetical protein